MTVENPIANADQMAGEEAALRLWSMPEIQTARHKAAFLWRLAYDTDLAPQDTQTFDSAMDEYACNYVIKAAASDARHPRFVRNFVPPFHSFGREVPGARMGGENPDSCYRLAGIEHGARYEVQGRIVCTRQRSVPVICVHTMTRP